MITDTIVAACFIAVVAVAITAFAILAGSRGPRG